MGEGAKDAMTSPPAQVSVVIPTFNGVGRLLACLRSVQQQTAPPLEIWVMDNGSSDGTAEQVARQFPSVRIIRHATNLGFVGACNRGWQEAHGSQVLFLNDDTTLDPHCLERVQEALDHDPAAGVCCSKILLQGREPATLDHVSSYMTKTGFLWHAGLYEVDRGQFDHLTYLFSPKGVCFLVRRDLLEMIGGFDPRYFAYFEETDFAWRVWLAGSRIRFVPTSVVYHHSAATSGKLDAALINFHAFKNRIRSLLKNMGGWGLLQVLPVHLTICLGLSLTYCMQGRMREGAAIPRAILWNFRVLPETLAMRWHIQRQVRRVSDRQLRPVMMRPGSWAFFFKLYQYYAGFWKVAYRHA